MALRKLVALAAVPFVFVGTPAMAQDEEAAGAWEFDGEIAAFSDYRFRGVSLSGKDPQVTLDLSASHESGLYAGAWFSNVDLGGGADDLEVDLYAGWARDVGGLTFDIGAVYYLYPGNGAFDYIELTSSLTAPVGAGEVSLGIAYAPSQGALGNTDNAYVYLSGDMPLGDSAFSLHGTVGLEDGAFGNSKVDWLLGVSAELGSGVSMSLDYVDTARAGTNLGDPTAAFSLAFSF